MGFSAVFLVASASLIALCSSSVSKSSVVKLDETNWTVTLNDEWMLEFMAPWCPACTSLKSTWNDLGTSAKSLGINVAEIDVTSAPGLSGRFLVTALPTIYHVINGEFRQYKGPRDLESLFSYVETKRWKASEPIPWWKNPNSIQMSYVSYFFRLSQMLRVVHNVLLEEYGLPTWGSYIVFALATILLGSIIGLLMVACIDLLYPQKSSEKKSPPPPTLKDEVEVIDDDLVDEEEDNSIEDDAQDEDDEKNSQSDTPDESESEPETNEKIEASGSDKDNTSSPNVRKRKAVRKEK